ncbi:glycosyltransferase family 2 protein [Hymenobacter sp. BT559]|uniref:glycosyltransferase family 2 protein n=1 Tax=Hymenobacter sp. BT559 TaxID=2795729 RepID=UPI0018EBC31C|nr:glycosyltransferase family 2 protein [Hymenobacter sp. BT559]MBJ6144328.1 glycosyltransferase family 2 protein [Hymenobacter sp. BT559]
MDVTQVSIVIPTYKRPIRVIEAVRSCLNQILPPYEIVIGDDSPDTVTEEAINQIISTTSIPIRYIRNTPSLGQVNNVNNLFSNAKGGSIMLLHDDDLILPESLSTLTAILANDPTISIAYGRQYIINEQSEIDPVSSISFNKAFYRDAEFEGSILTPFEAGLSQQIPNNGYLIRAAVLEKVRLRSEANDGCDFDFGFQLGKAGYKTYFINKYLGMYRLSAQSISSSKTSDMASQAFRLIRDCAADTPRAKSIRAKRMLERAPIAITEYAIRGNRKDAFEIYFSKWYRGRIISLGGAKRFIQILFPSIFNR